MSVLGSSSIGGLNLAGSLAGAQRNNAGDDEVKATAADRKFQQDQKAQSAQSLGDVAQTDRSADRDADGRLPYHPHARPDARDADNNEDGEQPVSADAFGERGRRLDLQA